MQTKVHWTVLCVLFGLLSAGRADAVSDDFSSNPLALGSPWSFGAGSNANSQFAWSPAALTVHLNSSLPVARLDRPLGTTLNDSASFQLSAQFSFDITNAPADQGMQIAFGLVNHTVTGSDRTGMPANFFSANTYDTFEFNYFPNASAFGPTLAPAVFGGPDPSGYSFANFASIFGPPSNLGDNVNPDITELPQHTTLEADLAYDGISKIVTLTMYQVGPGNALTILNTGVPALDLGQFGSGYDLSNPFVVDTLSIMAYNDGFTTADNPSLMADVTFGSISLVVPEPSSVVLALLAGLCLVSSFRRKRRKRSFATF